MIWDVIAPMLFRHLADEITAHQVQSPIHG